MTIPDKYEFTKVYSGTAEELKKEVAVFTLENIRKYPEYQLKWDDFYSMWLRFGPEAARTILIPYIWDGRFPAPKEAICERRTKR